MGASIALNGWCAAYLARKEQLKVEPHLFSRRPHLSVHSVAPQPVDDNVLVS